MVTAEHVGRYKQDGFYWAHAADAVAITPKNAWAALERLLTDTLRRVPTISNRPIEVLRTGTGGSLLGVGAQLRTRAKVLAVIGVPMRLTVIAVQPGRYVRIAVNKNFADIDFRIDADNDECVLTYRQGFQQGTLLGWIGANLTFGIREVPETAAILNTWVQTATATHG
ncbi:hypothetical protein [Mycobacterium spongiae]|uniref:DUF1990 domain-containing protein n=1 Tax=Mycobacterium spongiae TaxID=886343 RepID=A0A975JXX8_9MYCO|nr:hypothetical protein [Mycobacterium spongiae]QUR67734.1 hypothetical protein F6B93_12040 [Mycobacterium spongiae]